MKNTSKRILHDRLWRIYDTREKTERIWRIVAQALPKERAVNKDNHFIVICMFAGMLPGLAFGFVTGILFDLDISLDISQQKKSRIYYSNHGIV